MPKLLPEKMKFLEENEFVYHIKRKIYINPLIKKIISVEAIDDKPLEWLKECISKNNNKQWEFYFVDPPSEVIKKEIVEELER